MKFKEKTKRILASILCAATVMTGITWPTITSDVVEAEASWTEVVGNMNTIIGGDGKPLYDIYIKDGFMYVEAEYYHSSTATLSYHTKCLYITKDPCNGYPTDGDYYKIEVPLNRASLPSTQGSDYVREQYKISVGTLKTAIDNVLGMGASQAGKVEFYISEGYILKTRPNASTQTWTYKTGKVYDNIDDIRGAASWSSTTAQNFKEYYDMKVSFNLVQYTVSASADTGGITQVSKAKNYFGDEVTVSTNATNKQYTFTGWEVISGNPYIEDYMAQSLTFSMPEEDVVLLAHYENTTGPTLSPTPTPKPSGTPEPTKEPTLTPVPTPFIPEEVTEYKQYIRYYTTDAGYTMNKIYGNNGYISSYTNPDSEKIQSSRYTMLDANYSVGTDASGNEWYFRPSSGNAVKVHPKKYNGYVVDSEDVKHITELVFPSSITSGGTTYAVTDIGGGSPRYRVLDYISYNSSDGTSGQNGEWDGSYGYYSAYESYTTSSTNYFHSQYENLLCMFAYGVIGNGFITSSGDINFYWYNNGTETEQDRKAENSYYVHNTTLKRVVIPESVTSISQYAFWGCQALEEIVGCTNVTTLGEYAFAANSHLVPNLSVNESSNQYVYYYYNDSYSFTAETTVMREWQKTIRLSDYLTRPTFSAVSILPKAVFMWRTNLKDFVVPSSVTKICEQAFAGCELASIDIQKSSVTIESGKDFYRQDSEDYYGFGAAATLGTKGTNDKTIIYTVPDSTAMEYGFKQDDYYILRCGHRVTYYNNATPSESYYTIAPLEVLTATAQQVEHYDAYHSSYQSYQVYRVLAEDGCLYNYGEGDVSATLQLGGAKVDELYRLETRHWNGSEYTLCPSFIAITRDGQVYVSCSCVTSWKSAGLPSGATQIQVSGNAASGDSSAIWLYYLNASGNICCACATLGTASGSSSASSGFGTFRHTTLFSGQTFKNFSIDKRNTLFTTSSESAPPCIVGCTTSGDIILSTSTRGSSYSDIGPRYVTPVTIDTSGELAWANTDGNTFHVQALKSNGDIVQYNFRYSSDVVQGNNGTPSSTTTLGNIGAVTSAKAWSIPYTNTVQGLFVFETNASVYVYSNLKEKVSSWFPAGINPKRTWSNLFNTTISSETYACNVTFVLGDNDNLYVAYVCGRDGWSTSSDAFGCGTFVSNVKKICRYGSSLLVLDKNGAIWSTGKNNFGALGSENSYPSYNSSTSIWYYCSADKVSGSNTFTDIGINKSLFDNSSVAFKTSYAVCTDGYLYAAGTDTELLGSNAQYRGFAKTSELANNFSKYVANQSFRCGYRFSDVIFESNFENPGKQFTSWNTRSGGSGTRYMPGDTVELTAPLNLYAQWEKAYTTVRYNANGGEGIMEDDVYEPTVNSVTLKSNAFTKQGHTFLGWALTPDGSVVYQNGATISPKIGEINILYAKWSEGSYTLQIAGKEYIEGIAPSITETRTLKFSATTTIPAALGNKTYTVGYDPAPGALTAVLTSANTTATLNFIGWDLYRKVGSEYVYLGSYTSGASVSGLSEEAGDTLILYPYWSGDASRVLLPLAQKNGYDFLGWNSPTVGFVPVGSSGKSYYTPVGNETMTAYYEPKTYDIPLIAENATEHTQTSVTMTFDAKVPNVTPPKRTNYIFLGYYSGVEGTGTQYYDRNGNGFINWTIYDGSVSELYALWIPDKAVAYHANGGSGTEKTVFLPEGVNIAILEDNFFTPPTGYLFEGWNTAADGNGTTYPAGHRLDLSSSIGTVHVYAKWRPVRYSLEVYSDEYTITPHVLKSTINALYDADFTVPAALEKKVYAITFDLNRKSKSTMPSFVSGSSSASSVYPFAYWSLYAKSGSTFTSKNKNYSAGAKDKNLTTTEGTIFALFPHWDTSTASVALPVAKCDGYNFIGWTTNKDATNTSSVLSVSTSAPRSYAATKDTAFYAYYEAKTYVVALEAANATEHTQTSVTMTFDAMAPNVTIPKRTNYIFRGYYTSANGGGTQYYDRYGKGTKVWQIHNGSVTKLYAYWEPLDAICYNPNEGVGQPTTTYYPEGTATATVGNNIFTPPTGYHFVTWNTSADGNGTSYAPGSTMDLTQFVGVKHLYAQWAPNEYYLAYDYGNGTIKGTNPSKAIYDTPFNVELPLYNKKGYAFTGWKITGAKDWNIGATAGYIPKYGTTMDTMFLNLTNVEKATVNFTATYAWDESLSYKIRFHANPLTYQLSASDVAFGAWSAYGKIASECSATTLAGYFSNKGGVATGTDSEFGHKYGGSFPTISATGATFVGWNTKADGSGVYVSAPLPQKAPGSFTLSDGSILAEAKRDKRGIDEELDLFAIWKETTVASNLNITVSPDSTEWYSGDMAVTLSALSKASGIYRLVQTFKKYSGEKISDITWYPGGDTRTKITAIADTTNKVIGTPSLESGSFDRDKREMVVTYQKEGTYLIDFLAESRSVKDKYTVEGASVTGATRTIRIDKTTPTFTDAVVFQDNLKNHKAELTDAPFVTELLTTFTVRVNDKGSNTIDETDVSGIKEVILTVSDGEVVKNYPMTLTDSTSTLYGGHVYSGAYTKTLNLYDEFAGVALTYTISATDYAGNTTSGSYALGLGNVTKSFTTQNALTGNLRNFCVYGDFRNNNPQWNSDAGLAYFQAGEFGSARVWTYGRVEGITLDFGVVNEEAKREISEGLLEDKYLMNRTVTLDGALANFLYVDDIRIPTYYQLQTDGTLNPDGTPKYTPERHYMYAIGLKRDTSVSEYDDYIIYDKISNDVHYRVWPLG